LYSRSQMESGKVCMLRIQRLEWEGTLDEVHEINSQWFQSFNHGSVPPLY
jgi:ABC-type transporter Mla maintaining outer membrane lipid asymmetry ATPase subunit MlaF